jgi:heparosan-N-sulfate-glucuronate 5-epimerase
MLVALRTRWDYWRRVAAAYLTNRGSQLTFWHETPAVTPDFSTDRLGLYYMPFAEKADYAGPFDAAGIPMLDYRGKLGLRYNPIAIAQYGLGNYNLYVEEASRDREERFLAAADWLVARLEPNEQGVWVWNHDFDWEYRSTLRAPWYSGLAQGQGISLLLRAHAATGKDAYADAAEKAFVALTTDVTNGGALYIDGRGDKWIEEYVVSPPTHILNGFMWALWGVNDFRMATGSTAAAALFDDSVGTLRSNLATYDTGWWSLYEHSGTRLPMLASPFYHRLHIVQLRVMSQLTGDDFFDTYADKWERYAQSPFKRRRALAQKILFKIVHY